MRSLFRFFHRMVVQRVVFQLLFGAMLVSFMGCGTLTLRSVDAVDNAFSLGLMRSGNTTRNTHENTHVERRLKVTLSPQAKSFEREDSRGPLIEEAPPLREAAKDLTNPRDRQSSIGGSTRVKSSVFFQCTASERTTFKDHEYVEDSLRWPVVFGFGLPLAIGSSLALLAAGTTAVFAYQSATGDEVPEVWLIAGAVGFGVVLGLDTMGVATSLSSDDEVKSSRSHQERQTEWTVVQNACEGARLKGNGFNVEVSANGTVAKADEERMVLAWIRDKGPLRIEILHVDYPLYISPAQKCTWAKERSLRMPEVCSDDEENAP